MSILTLISCVCSSFIFDYQVDYVRNYDGDTFTCNFLNTQNDDLFAKKINIRLRGIDTEEIRSKEPARKARALAAKQELKKILTAKNARIYLQNCSRGKYFRVVADVVVLQDDPLMPDTIYVSNALQQYAKRPK